MTRRQILLATFSFRRPMGFTPATFPWAVDGEGSIGRRTVVHPILPEPHLVDLTPLHFALESYMSRPDDPVRIARVKHHLRLVQSATSGPLPYPWREMNCGCRILLNAPKWQPRF